MDENNGSQSFVEVGTGNVKKIYVLIKKETEENEILFSNKSPLVIAIHCGDSSRKSYDLIVVLIKPRADVNYRYPVDEDSTPLIVAFIHNCCDKIIKLLISAGSNVNATCKERKTPLIYAVEKYYSKEIIDLLINSGADVNHKCSVERSPLLYAVRKNRDPEIIESLINAGADVSVQDKCGKSLFTSFDCMHCSAVNCEYKALLNILVRYFDITLTDENGNTIIHHTQCNYLIAKAVKRGVSVDVKNKHGHTPLMAAYFDNNFEKLKDLLVYFKADPNCVDETLSTPLHYKPGLRMDFHIFVIDFLLYHGADLQARNENRNTPLDVMILSGFEDDVFEEWDFTVVLKHYLLFIDEDGLKNYIQLFHYIRKHSFNRFISKCKSELAKMRCLFMNNYLSIYDFCKLRKLYHSKFVPNLFNDNKLVPTKIIQMFPIYENLILSRIRDNYNCVEFKRILLKRLEKVIVRSFSVKKTNDVVLMFDCLYHVGLHLNKQQIYNLFIASI